RQEVFARPAALAKEDGAEPAVQPRELPQEPAFLLRLPAGRQGEAEVVARLVLAELGVDAPPPQETQPLLEGAAALARAAGVQPQGEGRVSRVVSHRSSFFLSVAV